MPPRPQGVAYRRAIEALENAHAALAAIIQAHDELREQAAVLLETLASVVSRDDGRSQ